MEVVLVEGVLGALLKSCCRAQLKEAVEEEEALMTRLVLEQMAAGYMVRMLVG